MPLREVGTSISVITQEESPVWALFAVRRAAPAGSPSPIPAVPAAPAALRIRGEEGYRTLVLLGGIDVDSDTSGPTGQPRFEQI